MCGVWTHTLLKNDIHILFIIVIFLFIVMHVCKSFYQQFVLQRHHYLMTKYPSTLGIVLFYTCTSV